MELARRRGNPEVYPEHLCIALLDQELPRTLVERAGDAVDAVRGACEAQARARSRPSGGTPSSRTPRPPSRRSSTAPRRRCALDDEYVSIEHLLLALDVDPRDKLLDALKEVRGTQRVTSQDPEGSYQALEKFGRDLTELPSTASSTRSSGATRRFAASSRCSRAGRRTTRC